MVTRRGVIWIEMIYDQYVTRYQCTKGSDYVFENDDKDNNWEHMTIDTITSGHINKEQDTGGNKTYIRSFIFHV